MSLHTPEQVAQELAVSKSTVMRLIARGELAAMKVRGQWRVHPDALAAYLRAAMPPAELPTTSEWAANYRRQRETRF